MLTSYFLFKLKFSACFASSGAISFLSLCLKPIFHLAICNGLVIFSGGQFVTQDLKSLQLHVKQCYLLKAPFVNLIAVVM